MPGKTPLVGWIKGYMVPELMGIEVIQIYIFSISSLPFLPILSIHSFQVDDVLMEQRPADYGGMKTYLKKTYDRVEK